MPDVTLLPWRVGRSTGRTIWAVMGGDPDDDFLMGMLDTRVVAAEAVEAHNARLPYRETWIG